MERLCVYIYNKRFGQSDSHCAVRWGSWWSQSDCSATKISSSTTRVLHANTPHKITTFTILWHSRLVAGMA